MTDRIAGSDQRLAVQRATAELAALRAELAALRTSTQGRATIAAVVIAMIVGVLAGGIYVGSAITEEVDASWIARGCK